jgi:8-oxo-dGTP pyrophosphatase MutT (NUDIX family)
VDARSATALAVAAIRECAEEAGIALVRGRVSGPLATAARVLEDMGAGVLEAMRAGAAFGAALETVRCIPDVAALSPWSWWITPHEEPKRFDTRFFLAEVAAEATAQIDEHEVVEHVWLTPGDAVRAYRVGNMVLAPPTLCTLEDLAAFASVDEARASVRLPLRAICPKLVVTHGGLVLALPGDPLHDDPAPVFSTRTRLVRTTDGRFISTSEGSPT